MIGDTITLTIGGAGGTAITLAKIREDNYASEYFCTFGTDPVIRATAKVKHSKEKVASGAPLVDRHNVTFRFEWGDGSSAHPVTFREATIILRNTPDDVAEFVADLGQALTYWASEAMLEKVIGWES